MLAVWSWLRELIELEREVSAEEAAKALTAAGLEVEELRRVGEGLSGVVIAEVVAKEKHPQADKLTLVKVITAPGGPATDVVCGAPNVPEPGGRVLWARPGALLPGGIAIGKKTLKGVESAGMLCSEEELGISDEHAGIVVLGAREGHLELGADAATALGLVDVVFDLSIPANRADALGHLGLARELAALLGGRARLPDVGRDAHATRLKKESGLKITIENPDLCRRYVALRIEGVTVGASPLWMQQRLRNVGVRPINNLVDITNYVMFELGQPLHAFDGAKVDTGAIHVRNAREDERLVTLDDQERSLTAGDLLITDGTRGIALAGVMGGANSEVDASTRQVILESACFDPLTIRRTARRLGLHSEASHRFERGVDPNGAAFAAQRAGLLMADWAGATVIEPFVDLYPVPVEDRRVMLRLSRCAALTGIELERGAIEAVLSRQGLQIEGGTDEAIAVRVPTFRGDIEREVDLIEEVVRIYGFDRVPATLPRLSQAPRRRSDIRSELVRSAMCEAGFCETVTYSFTSRRRIDNLGLVPDDPRSRPIPITNPLSLDLGVMRTTLWANLLAAVEHNWKRDVHDVALFELGHCYLESGGEMPREPLQLGAVLTGRRDGWLSPGQEVDFFDLKGRLDSLLDALYGETARAVRFIPGATAPYLHPGVAANIEFFGKKIGEIGELHPTVRERFDLHGSVFGFVLDLESMPDVTARQMAPMARFPAITRDISMLVDVTTLSREVIEIIEESAPSWLADARVLEDYRDPAHVPAGKKGMLWSITYRSPERTLTDAEVDAIHGPLEDRLLRELAATRR